MKACIYIGTPCLDWCRKYFPDKPPGELPIAGKEWCAYLLDLCSMLGDIDKLYIVDCYPAERLSSLSKRSGYWSTKLTYLSPAFCPSPTELLQAQPRIPCTPEEGLLLFWGMPLPKLTVPEDLLRDLRPANPAAQNLPAGVYLWQNGKFYECACPLHPLNDIENYFELNFTLLKNPGIYTLPGYTDQKDQGIGRNITILPNCTLEPPLIIQDNCYLGRSLTLTNGVILGRNTLLDDYTTVKHSVILDNTYLGSRMYLEDKIVCGNRVIDVHSGAFVDLQEEFLAMDSRRKLFDRFRVVSIPIAAILIISLLPWFLLGCLFKTWLDKVPFFHLLFRVYPKCWGVLVWKTNLVRVGAKDPDYAFRFLDRYLLPYDEKTLEQGDVYYQQHRTISMMVGVVCRSLLKRLFQLSEPPPDTPDELPPKFRSSTPTTETDIEPSSASESDNAISTPPK